MPVPLARLEPGVLVRFAGPYVAGVDDAILDFDEKKEKGPVFRVERKSLNSVVLVRFDDPEKWIRWPVKGGFAERLMLYEKSRDEIERDAAQRAASLAEFREQFGEHIAAFDARQRSPIEQKEIEKMKEIRQKLYEMNQRKQAERREDDAQR